MKTICVGMWRAKSNFRYKPSITLTCDAYTIDCTRLYHLYVLLTIDSITLTTVYRPSSAVLRTSRNNINKISRRLRFMRESCRWKKGCTALLCFPELRCRKRRQKIQVGLLVHGLQVLRFSQRACHSRISGRNCMTSHKVTSAQLGNLNGKDRGLARRMTMTLAQRTMAMGNVRERQK